MNRFREWMYRVMQGRYGVDQLNRFLLIVAVVLMLLSAFARTPFLSMAVFITLLYMYFRMFSRNLPARREENAKFLQFRAKVFGRGRGNGYGGNQADPAHRIFNCPDCRQKVRVPSGRGHIQIRCPKCGHEFIRET